MIRVFDKLAEDFSTNGLGTVEVLKCTVSEMLNGMYELELTCDVDRFGKWGFLALDNIVVAPVPAGTTPLVTMPEHVEEPSVTNIYRVNGGSVNFRKGPGMSYKIMKVLHKGDLVTLVNKKNANWYKIIDKSGTSGYMWHEYLTFHKTETATPIGSSATVSIDPHTVRDQPFRIYDIIPGLNEIKVRARHLFYDLADNMILSAKFKKVAGNVAGPQLFDSCMSPHDFDFYTDITKKKSAEFAEVSPVEVLLGDEGFIDTWGGELMRDWYEVFVMKKLGKNRNVTVRYGKNLLSIGGSQSNDNAVSRIIPVGQTKDGKPLYLPEKFIESTSKASFPHPRYAILKVDDAKEHENKKDPNDKDNPTVTKAQCYTMMREAAAEEFENGADLMDLSLNIDFVMLENMVEYRDFAALQDIFLGDTVQVIVERLGLTISLRMTEYVFNCLTRQYESITLGQATGNVATGISPRQLPNGKISGTKLGYGSVSGGALQDGAVGALQIGEAAIGSAHIEYAAIQTAHIGEAAIDSAHIGDAVIETAHIKQATIDDLNAGSITAINGYIENLVSENITTDTLYAALATIAVAQITTANIDTANIDWAAIETLTADMAAITKAVITGAVIHEAEIDWATIANLKAAVGDITNLTVKNAEIDYAQIKDLTANTALIEKGVGGKFTFSKLDVTEQINATEINANKITAGTLSVERLVIMGSDQSIVYAINELNGTAQLSQTTIDGGALTQRTIMADRIIAGGITTNELSANSVSTDQLMALAVKAKHIRAGAIETDHLKSLSVTVDKLAANVGAALDISSNVSVRMAVSDAIQGLPEAIVGQQLDLSFSRGTYLDDVNNATVVSASVHVNAQDVTDNIPAICFVWERISEDPQADDLWNQSHQGLKSLTLTTDDIDFRAVIRCHIDVGRRLQEFSMLNGDLTVTNHDESAEPGFEIQALDLYADDDFVVYDDGTIVVRISGIHMWPTEATVVDRSDDPYIEALHTSLEVAKGLIVAEASRINELEGWRNETSLQLTPEGLFTKVSQSSGYTSDLSGKLAVTTWSTEKAALLAADIHVGNAAPTGPTVGRLWTDTSTTPAQLKRCTAITPSVTWQVVSDMSKADLTALKALTTRVDVTETEIEQTKDSILLAARRVKPSAGSLEEAMLDLAPDKIVTTVRGSNLYMSDLAAKVGLGDHNALKSRVLTAESRITQLPGEIKLEVETKFDNKLTSYSKISQTSDAITLAVGNLETSITSKLTVMQGSIVSTVTGSTAWTQLNNTVGGKASASDLSDYALKTTASNALASALSPYSTTSQMNTLLAGKTNITFSDTRSTNENPQWYWTNHPRRVVQEFKTRATMGAPGSATYGIVTTIVPWTDSSGGQITQRWEAQDGNGNVAERRSTSGTSWSAWVSVKSFVEQTADAWKFTATNILGTGVVQLGPGTIRVTHSSLSNSYTQIDASGFGIFNSSGTKLGGIFNVGGTVIMAASSLYNATADSQLIVDVAQRKDWTAFRGLSFRKGIAGGFTYGGLFANMGTASADSLMTLHSEGGLYITSRQEMQIHNDNQNIDIFGASQAWVQALNTVRLNGSTNRIESNLHPATHNVQQLGASGTRFAQIWCQQSLNSSSDRREKKDIRPLKGMLDFIMALNPVSYKWIENDSDRDHYGLIAQEVRQAMDDAGIDDFGGYIRGMLDEHREYDPGVSDDEVRYALRYDEFIAPLIAGLQEQQAEITRLKDRLERLEMNANG